MAMAAKSDTKLNSTGNFILVIHFYTGLRAKAAWLRGYCGRLRTERSLVRNPHQMLPPLVSQGDVVVPCKSELSGWRPLARVWGHGLAVKAIYTCSGPYNSAARYKQTNKHRFKQYLRFYSVLLKRKARMLSFR